MSCVDQSFGLLPKDTQLTNLKTNDIISANKLVTCDLRVKNTFQFDGGIPGQILINSESGNAEWGDLKKQIFFNVSLENLSGLPIAGPVPIFNTDEFVLKGPSSLLMNVFRSGPTQTTVSMGGNMGSGGLPSGTMVTNINRTFTYQRQNDGIVCNRQGQSAANAPGAYNGGGTGNKILLQFSDFNGKSISDLEYIKVIIRYVGDLPPPANAMYINIFVKCVTPSTWVIGNNALSDAIITASSVGTPAMGTLTNSFSVITVNASDSAWTVAGLIGHYGLNGIPGPALPLSNFNVPIGAPHISPQTCFNGTVTDGGLAFQSFAASIAIVNGDSTTLNPCITVIQTVFIKFLGDTEKVYNF